MNARFVATLTLLLLQSHACFGQVLSSTQADIAEAVLRNLFILQPHTNKTVYCILVNFKDPDDSFLDRFNTHDPPVAKRSECLETGLRAFKKDQEFRWAGYDVRDIKVITETTAEAWGTDDNNLYSFNLTRTNSTWVIDKSTLRLMFD